MKATDQASHGGWSDSPSGDVDQRARASLIQLTAEDRLIWCQLRDRARSGSLAQPEAACHYYRDLGRLVDPDGVWTYPMSRPPFRDLNEALGRVSQYEHEHGRPLLSSLVVAMNSSEPGPGFATFAAGLGIHVDDPHTFWQDEVRRTVAFWSTGQEVWAFDSAIDSLRAEVVELRRLIGPLAV